MRILLSVDGSSYSKRMLAYVGAHEEWLGPSHQYTVVHVVPKVPPRVVSFVGREVVNAHYHDEADRIFRPVRTFFKHHGIDADYVARTGHIATAVARLATEGGFSLLIMGSHGHGNAVNLVLGSVATQVLADCRVPVLLVR